MIQSGLDLTSHVEGLDRFHYMLISTEHASTLVLVNRES